MSGWARNDKWILDKVVIGGIRIFWSRRRQYIDQQRIINEDGVIMDIIRCSKPGEVNGG